MYQRTVQSAVLLCFLTGCNPPEAPPTSKSSTQAAKEDKQGTPVEKKEVQSSKPKADDFAATFQWAIEQADPVVAVENLENEIALDLAVKKVKDKLLTVKQKQIVWKLMVAKIKGGFIGTPSIVFATLGMDDGRSLPLKASAPQIYKARFSVSPTDNDPETFTGSDELELRTEAEVTRASKLRPGQYVTVRALLTKIDYLDFKNSHTFTFNLRKVTWSAD